MKGKNWKIDRQSTGGKILEAGEEEGGGGK